MPRNSLVILFLILPLLAIAQDKTADQIEKMIIYDTDLDRDAFPHMLIGIIDRDSTYIIQLTGEKETAIDEQSVFEIGSVTKPIISYLVTSMSQKNLLDLDDKIGYYIPEISDSKTGELTIKQCLLQLVDLPRIPAGIGKYELNDEQPYALYPPQALYEYLSREDIDPEKKASYSHIPHALMEAVIVKACNCSIEEALRQYLIEPLNLKNTGFKIAPVEGYRLDGKPSKPWNFSTFITSLGLRSDIRDLSTFMRAQFKAVKKLPLSEMKPSRLGDNIYQSLAWMVVEDLGLYPIYHFSGRSNGNSAEICFIPETKTGVIILTDTGRATQDLPFLILRMINKNWKRKR